MLSLDRQVRVSKGTRLVQEFIRRQETQRDPNSTVIWMKLKFLNMSKQKLQGTNDKVIQQSSKMFINQGLIRSVQPTL